VFMSVIDYMTNLQSFTRSECALCKHVKIKKNKDADSLNTSSVD
jgi:hypothetical protein